jgi:hypothetical protein
MPVRLPNGTFVDIPLAECAGRQCDDGKYHVILKDGSHGLWVRPEEVEAEKERHAKAVAEWNKPKTRRVNFSDDIVLRQSKNNS